VKQAYRRPAATKEECGASRCPPWCVCLFLSLFGSIGFLKPQTLFAFSNRCIYFCLGGPHPGVGRVGLGPPVGVFPLPTLEFSEKEIVIRRNHDVNPPQVGDLVGACRA